MAAPSDLKPDEQAQMDIGITPVVSAVDVAVDEVGAEIALGAAKEALAAAGVNAVEAGTGSAAAAKQRSRGKERRTRKDSVLKKGRGGSAAETNKNKSIHKSTGKSKQLQRHNRESSSSAFPLAISVQTRSSGIAAGRFGRPWPRRHVSLSLCRAGSYVYRRPFSASAIRRPFSRATRRLNIS